MCVVEVTRIIEANMSLPKNMTVKELGKKTSLQ